ncbi:hypothetical protein BTVI_51990 [Pitangus sulphuratus]|nr:hypothetical protein BTVI_51990 [Pitangus sulphuratus]
MECRIAHRLGTLVMHVCMYVTIVILCSIALSQHATLKKSSDTQYSQAVSENFSRRLLQAFRKPKFAKCLCVGIWLIVLCITVTAITYDVQASGSKDFPSCYNIQSVQDYVSFKFFICIKLFLGLNAGKAFVQYRQFEKLQIEYYIRLALGRIVHGGKIPENLKGMRERQKNTTA